MTDYSNSCVYKLSCKDENIKEVYIGSTTNLYMRKFHHKSSCNNENIINYNSKLYKFIRENGGYDNWEFNVLEEVNCNNKTELEIRERYHIELHDNNLNQKIPTRNIKEYYEDNKTKILEYKKKYYVGNKEYKKKYYEGNKEKISERSKEYYEDNKTKILEYSKKYREDHKEILSEYHKEYRKNNKEIKNKINKKYRENNKDKIKQYYQDNKQEILEHGKKLKHCDFCNCDITNQFFLRHTRTKKHKKNLELNLNMVCEKIKKI